MSAVAEKAKRAVRPPVIARSENYSSTKTKDAKGKSKLQNLRFTIYANSRDKRTSTTKELTWPEALEVLTKHAERAEKEGPGFSPVTFKPSPCTCPDKRGLCPKGEGHALNQNVEAVHLLGIDLDKNENGGPLRHEEAKRHLKHIQGLGVAAVFHSTHSYAPPEKSTWRVFFALSRPVTGEEFKPFWRAAIRFLGIPTGIKTDFPARFWHAPSCPPDTTPEAGHFEGVPLDVDALLSTVALPPAVPIIDPATSTVDHTYPPASEEILSKAAQALQDHGQAVEGDCGDNHTYQACAIALNDYALSHHEALGVLLKWDADNRPPWGSDGLHEKMANAENYASGEFAKARHSCEFTPGTTGKPTPRRGRIVSTEQAITEMYEFASKPRLKTPFAVLNQITGGGLMPGEYTCINGGTGSGKTSLVLMFAAQCAREDTPVVFVSYELKGRSLVARIAAQNIPGATWNEVLAGKYSKEMVRDAVPDMPTLENMPTGEVVLKVKAVAERYGKAPLVIVDYLQLLGRVANGDADARTSATSASDALREMASETGCVIIVVSSVSRENTKHIKDARSHHPGALVGAGKDSGDIEYSAGVVLVVGHTGQLTDDGASIATLTVAKNRYGEQSHLDMRFHGKSGRWEECGLFDQKRVDGDAKNRKWTLQIFEALEHGQRPIKGGIKEKVTGKGQPVGYLIDRLREEGFIENSGGYALTDKGREKLAAMRAEGQ